MDSQVEWPDGTRVELHAVTSDVPQHAAGEDFDRLLDDLAVGPPPNLALEVDISRSSLNKFGIYQALGVPEIWRFYGDKLEIFVLQQNEYVEVDDSLQLPGFPTRLARELLEERQTATQSEIMRSFRKWLSENFST